MNNTHAYRLFLRMCLLLAAIGIATPGLGHALTSPAVAQSDSTSPGNEAEDTSTSDSAPSATIAEPVDGDDSDDDASDGSSWVVWVGVGAAFVGMGVVFSTQYMQRQKNEQGPDRKS